MTRKAAFAAAVLALFWLVTPTAVAKLGSFSRLACYDAVAEIEGIRCGYVEVPVDRERERSRTMRLRVVILQARDPDPSKAPVAILTSGSNSALEPAHMKAFTDQPVRRERDLILIDQRGFGLSKTPCEEEKQRLLAAFAADMGERPFQERFRALIGACLDRLGKFGVPAHALGYDDMAADVEAVRRALHHKKLNLWAFGFSTRTALAVMRRYPERVRSVVLDSPQPPGALWMRDWRRNFARVVDRMSAACHQRPSCPVNSEFSRYLADASATLVVRPMSYEVDIPGYSAPRPFVLNALGYQLMLQQLPLARDVLPIAPIAMRSVAERREGAVGNLTAMFWDWTSVLSLATLYSNACADRRPGDTGNGPIDPSHRHLFAFDFAKLCKAIGVAAAGPTDRVTSPVPTLLLHSEYSTESPRRYATRIARGLERSFILNVPRSGRRSSEWVPCARRTANAFLDDPERPPADDCSGAGNQDLAFDPAWLPEIFSVTKALHSAPVPLVALGGLAMLVFAGAALGWPVKTLLDGRPGRFDAGRAARYVLGAYAFLGLVCLLLLAAGLYHSLTTVPALTLFGLPKEFALVRPMWTLLAVGAPVAAVLAVLAWTRGWYGRTTRLCAAGVAGAGTVCAGFALAHGLV